MDENKTLSASEIESEIQLGIANLVQRALVNDMIRLRLRIQTLEADLAALKTPEAASN
jgi:hypothetical protein